MTTSLIFGNKSRRAISVPRWPPASFASTIMAAAPSFSASLAKAGEETMETMAHLMLLVTFLVSWREFGVDKASVDGR